MLFSLGQNALVAISERLEDGERLLAGANCCSAQYFARRVVATCQDQRARKDTHLESWWCWFSRKQQRPWTRAPEFGGAVTRTDQRTKESPSWVPPWGDKNSLNGNIIADRSELFTRIPDMQDLQCA